jgi:hypothetical protein
MAIGTDLTSSTGIGYSKDVIVSGRNDTSERLVLKPSGEEYKCHTTHSSTF